MDALITSAIRALHSLAAPGMLEIFVKSVGVTVLSLIGFIMANTLFFAWLAHTLAGTAASNFMPWLGSLPPSQIAWVLFPGLMPVIIHFFVDIIALLIEERDYPKSMHVGEQAFWPKMAHDLKFSLFAMTLNLLVLPLYLLPGLNLVLFYLLNGYLLGREFFSMAARRHIPAREINDLYHRHSTVIFLAGIVLAVMATIPIANLLAPFWGIAVMVHLYHRLKRPVVLERVL